MKKIIVFLMLWIAVMPVVAFGTTADLSIRSSDIKFSTDTFVSGSTERVYMTVKNVGEMDMSGYVAFYLGANLIESSQVVTLVSGGKDEETWADFIVPNGPFNIRVELKAISPDDENSANNIALSPLYTVVEDADGDGIIDSNDNCVDNANATQVDTDNDGLGDVCDSDDDNDSLSDDFEIDLGTNPKNFDTDGDGVADAKDYYPSDKTRSTEEVRKETIPEVISDVAVEPIIKTVIEDTFNDDEGLLNGLDVSLEKRISDSKLNISPAASFVFFNHDWKTYEFEALVTEGSYSVLGWDFGDGTSSAQKSVEHEFRSPGLYTIKLFVTDNSGVVITDAQNIEISFFHLKNPLVQLMIGVLFILFIILILFTLKSRNGDDYILEKRIKKIEGKKMKHKTKKKSVKKKK